MRNRNFIYMYLVIYIFCCNKIFASSTVVSISASVVEPPSCIINHGEPIDVNFGDNIDINKINGLNYTKEIIYSLECAKVENSMMAISIVGEPASFDEGTALDARHNGLGIELKSNGKKIKLGKPISFTWPSIPALEAVPVRKDGADLQTGGFSVGATMIVSWQ